LHDREVEVMLLGKELGADLLIIDDYVAREYAKYLDFKITGSLGVILRAKRRELSGKSNPFYWVWSIMEFTLEIAYFKMCSSWPENKSPYQTLFTPIIVQNSSPFFAEIPTKWNQMRL
jgi:hypothetical protein